MESSAPVLQNIIVAVFLIGATLFEILSGRATNDQKSKVDWKMSGLCIGAMVLIQRPAVYLGVFLFLGLLVPSAQGSMAWLEEQYFVWALIFFLLLEDLAHGAGHWVCHTRPFRNDILRRIQAFYKVSHRPHHFSGGNQGGGSVSATQSFVEGWGYWFIMPNYWFQYIWLYLGMYETFMVGLIIKGLWSVHNHVNWNYDLYFLNHKNALVRKLMRGLCHILIFPTQHHHHHSRGKNSAKNLHNLFAFYDWLLWRTLVIETERPKLYGWKQSETEEESALARFFDTKLSRYLAKPSNTRKLDMGHPS
jgi:hypothetical protein